MPPGMRLIVVADEQLENRSDLYLIEISGPSKVDAQHRCKAEVELDARAQRSQPLGIEDGERVARGLAGIGEERAAEHGKLDRSDREPDAQPVDQRETQLGVEQMRRPAEELVVGVAAQRPRTAQVEQEVIPAPRI